MALVGDALHPMAMCEFHLRVFYPLTTTDWQPETDRGEGANHAIVDVLDFVELVLPQLTGDGAGTDDVRAALDRYEDRVVARTRPAVLASRQACLDAHDWQRINPQSPLLSRRAMNLVFDESSMS